MSNLKQDLDEYLLLQSDQKKNFNVKLPQIKVPSIFSRNTEPEANSWLKETQDTCCPQLVSASSCILQTITVHLLISLQSRLQRIIGFIACLGIAVFFMSLSTLYIPVLMLKPKFALLFTLGSLFFILSLCFLVGFQAFFKQMFSKPRLLTSISYSVCLSLTLYFALVVKSTALTVLCSVAQIITLLFMLLGMVPGGATGLKFFGQLFKSSVSASTSVLPV
ncbi:CG33635 [Drosophila busckii]|uniref:Vesicle transport protein n=1 Tax=Drosophila busckii TaxID=30019 RepID=A0A0M4EP41_DROBS|nr:CG33635 [Drosophila busckii]